MTVTEQPTSTCKASTQHASTLGLGFLILASYHVHFFPIVRAVVGGIGMCTLRWPSADRISGPSTNSTQWALCAGTKGLADELAGNGVHILRKWEFFRPCGLGQRSFIDVLE